MNVENMFRNLQSFVFGRGVRSSNRDNINVPLPTGYQFLTGVQENFRGRGLGKWLKAAMLLKLRDEYPDVEVLTTSNATSNEPMLAINQKMGFRMKLESYMFELDVGRVKDYLSQID